MTVSVTISKKGDAVEVVKILRKEGIGVLPTDTIYGLVCSAFSKKAVEKIYKIKKRKRDKPFIILISCLKDLKLFGIEPSKEVLALMAKIFPAKVSIILPCSDKKFFYLHRGKNCLAFRVPEKLWLRKFLFKTGPIVAPSANLEGKIPAETIKQAKEYFGDNVDFYFDKGRIKGKPSVILELKR